MKVVFLTYVGLKNGTYNVIFKNPLIWSPVIVNVDFDASDDRDSDGPIDVIVNLKDKSNANVDQGYYGTGEAGQNCDTGITPPADGGQVPDVKDSEKATVTPDSNNLPDTGEANNAAIATGAAAALLAGGALIAASRKRRDEEI